MKIIERNVVVPKTATKLDYHGVTISGNFSCSNTAITSLRGAPARVEGNFSCVSVKGLTALKGVSEYIGGSLYCHVTNITSLHNIHKQIRHIGNALGLPNSVSSHILGVMFIKGLKAIAFYEPNPQQKHVEAIINKHLAGNRNPHEVQEELIDAGLVEYSRL